MKIKYDTETIKTMNLFQALTKAALKDYFIDNNDLDVFVVKEFQLGKAVGKRASNVRLLEQKLNRKIKIVEFNPDVLQFTRNVVFPLKVENISEEDGVITIQAPDTKTRGLLIGRNAKNLRNTEKIVKRYFDIKEIKVA